MTTLADLKARILDELKRPSLTSQCALAVTDAIAYYAARRLGFNEVLDETSSTVAGHPAYAIPANFAALILAEVTDGGQRYRLGSTMDWDCYRSLTQGNPNAARPYEIIFYSDNYYLHPTPAGAYPLSLSYCSRLDTLTDTDSNGWTTTAEPLIRLRAKWDLLTNVIRDYAEADIVKAAELDALARLQERRGGRGGPKRARAMAF